MSKTRCILTDLNQSSCPDARLFDRYLKGMLNEEDKRVFDDHLKSCELCREAMEGYRQHTDLTDVASESGYLSGEIDKLVKNSNTNRPRSRNIYYLAAASFALLLISVLFWQIRKPLNNPDRKAEKTVFHQAGNSAENQRNTDSSVRQIAGNFTRQADNKTGIKSSAPDRFAKSPDIDFQVNIPEEEEKTDLSSNREVKAESEAPLVFSAPVMEKTEPEKSEKTIGQKNLRTNKDMPENQSLALTDSVSKSAFYYQNAMIEYERGNMVKAIEYASLSLTYRPSDIDVLYFLGFLNYQNGNYLDAVIQLQKVISEENKHSDDAQWYLAMSYLKSGNNTEARKILNKISSEDGPYREKATAELRKLK